MTDAKTAFNGSVGAHRKAHVATLMNDNILKVVADSSDLHTHTYYFDFLMRTVTMMVQHHTKDQLWTFSEFDREVLEINRQKLIDLGGKPRPLPDVLDKMVGEALRPGQSL